MDLTGRERGRGTSGEFMPDTPPGPRVIALPPLILGAAVGLGLIFNFLWPAPFWIPAFAAPLGLLLILAALAIAFLAVREMRTANTPLDVRKAPTRIVTSGIFQKSRNPIYLGMVLLCAGIGFLADSLWLLGFALLLAAILQKGVIEPEEIYLEHHFGADYLRYKAKVRRWL